MRIQYLGVVRSGCEAAVGRACVSGRAHAADVALEQAADRVPALVRHLQWRALISFAALIY
eukprot:COSAG05_NODE_1276_length_5305_cov_7.675759_8_plen_61_part_00